MRPRNVDKQPFSQEITWENFTYSAPDKQPSEKNSRVRFTRMHPEKAIAIKPDRYFDKEVLRYESDEARRAGDEAMTAWFEYIAFKSRDDKRFVETFNGMRSMLKAGYQLQFVCADPAEFDQAYIPASPPLLVPDFWRPWLLGRLRPLTADGERRRVIAGFKKLSNLDFSINNARSLPGMWRDPSDSRARDDFEAECLRRDREAVERASAKESRAAIDPSQPLPKLSAEALRIFKEASNPVETDEDLRECLG